MEKVKNYYCIGNDVIGLWGSVQAKESVATAYADLFINGQASLGAVRFVEDKYPEDNKERIRRLVPFMVFPLVRVNFWAFRLNLPLFEEKQAYSLKKAKQKSNELLMREWLQGATLSETDFIH
jgi:hypothetical protein